MHLKKFTSNCLMDLRLEKAPFSDQTEVFYLYFWLESIGCESNLMAIFLVGLFVVAMVHSDGVILRDDFDSSRSLDYTIWYVSFYC